MAGSSSRALLACALLSTALVLVVSEEGTGGEPAASTRTGVTIAPPEPGLMEGRRTELRIAIGRAAGSRLFVWAARGASACPASPAESVKTGAGRLLRSDFRIPSSSFAHRVGFAPGAPGRWRICAWLSARKLVRHQTQIVVRVRPAAGRLHRIAFDAPALRERLAISVTVVGATQARREVSVWVARGAQVCPATPERAAASRAGRFVRTGTRVGPGRFRSPSSFTPSLPGPHRICAWLIGSESGDVIAVRHAVVPVAAAVAGFTPFRLATADPVERLPLSFSVEGASELRRGLWIWLPPAGLGCPTTPAAASVAGNGIFLRTSAAIGPGNFSTLVSYTPGAPGSHLICAWVTGADAASAIASQQITVGVRAGLAAFTAVRTDSATRSRLAVTIDGSSEVLRELWVWVSATAAACPSTPAAAVASGEGQLIKSNSRIGPGAFSSSAGFTPGLPGTYRVCSWLTDPGREPAVTAIEEAVVVP